MLITRYYISWTLNWTVDIECRALRNTLLRHEQQYNIVMKECHC